jgi:hypothetical protein
MEKEKASIMTSQMMKRTLKKKIRETKLSPEIVKNIERDPELVRELNANIITSNE